MPQLGTVPVLLLLLAVLLAAIAGPSPAAREAPRAGAAPARPPSSAAPGEPGTPVRIAGVSYLGDLPTHVAVSQRLFEKTGIVARVIFSDSGRENLQRLRNGDVDFALMALTPLVIDLQADTTPMGADDPVILANLVHGGQLNQVVTLGGSGLNEVADLAGRRVGLMRGTNAELVWWLLSVSHDLAPDAAQVVDLPIDRLGDALLEGEVAGAVLWEPWTTRLRQRALPHGGLDVVAGSDGYVAKWVLVTRRSTVRQRQPLCEALLRVYGAAIDYIEGRPHDALRDYAALAGVAPAMLLETADTFQYGLNLDWSLVSSLQQQMAWARGRAGGGSAEGTSVLHLLMPGPLRSVDPGAVSIPLSTEEDGGSSGNGNGAPR